MSRKSDLEKYIKVVNSCQNPEQLIVAQSFGACVYAMHGEPFWVGDPFWNTPFLDKLVEIQNWKAKKLKHEREVRECQ
jgi:hypothetical protein